MTATTETRHAYVIERLEVFNWGPFQGLHRVPIDPRGSAIVGQTGSGKTTLVDALMTLIAERPLYNLASTGGHESDRDLVAYIRGKSGEGTATGQADHLSRRGVTETAISARLSDGEHWVTLGALFWFDGGSSALADLKRLWVFARDGIAGSADNAPQDLSVADWLTLFRDSGGPALKRGLREQGCGVHDTKKAYLAELQRYFEVGENAFPLLNRAAGLKQLNSVDDLFRNLVLENRAAFSRATKVIEGFDTLTGIHTELQTARAQQESLLPIREEDQRRQQRETELGALHRLQALLPAWFAEHALRLWQARLDELNRAREAAQGRGIDLKERERQLDADAEDRHRLYVEAGGGKVDGLLERIARQRETLQACTTARDSYLKLLATNALDTEISAAALRRNQEHARALRAEHEPQRLELERTRDHDAGAVFTAQHALDTLGQELKQARAHPDSNLPGSYLSFKRQLAEAIQLPPDACAFVAELIEVRAEETAWRGAIERAIGGNRLRLIVPAGHMQAALAWVNARDNRLHVRLLDAARYADTRAAQFFADGYTRKLNYAAHPLREVLKHFLAGQDLHCVADTEQLRDTEHALTQQGMISAQRGRFDKQDQRGLHENWMTGFDNRDRVATLEREQAAARQTLADAEHRLSDSKRALAELRQQMLLLEQLESLDFASIDSGGAQAVLDELDAQLDALQRPGSNTERARLAWESAKQAAARHREQITENDKRLAVLTLEHKRADERLREAVKRRGTGLSAAQQSLGDARFPIPDDKDIERLDALQREASEALLGEVERGTKLLATITNRLTSLMGKAQHIDTGALAEVGTEIDDIPQYLNQLELLTKEALPEKLDRFLNYLNQSSDQGVTQLLTHIDTEVGAIEERIEELNRTLTQVDFQRGHYLQLAPHKVVHHDLTQIQKAQRELRSAELKDDNGESHYRALMHLVDLLRGAVDKPKTVGAQALLDPRHRLQFYVDVINRESLTTVDTRSGSQGDSGGEKEIIASFVLTASLSYALCPNGLGRPLFGTVVLDEAFSRSSQAFARRIVEALRQFGLHPLFVTPNKEMRLLREHTRSAILVHRRGIKSGTVSLTWEEIDSLARHQLTNTP